jgi:hypothetical protein
MHPVILNDWSTNINNDLGEILSKINSSSLTSSQIFKEFKKIWQKPEIKDVVKVNKEEMEAIFDYKKPTTGNLVDTFKHAKKTSANPLSFLDEYIKAIYSGDNVSEEDRIEVLKVLIERIQVELKPFLPAQLHKFKASTLAVSDIVRASDLSQEERTALTAAGYQLTTGPSGTGDEIAFHRKTGEVYIIPYALGNIKGVDFTDVAEDKYHWDNTTPNDNNNKLEPVIERLIDSKNLSDGTKYKLKRIAVNTVFLLSEWEEFLSDKNLNQITTILQSFNPVNMLSSSVNSLPDTLNALKPLFSFDIVIMPFGGCKVGDDKTVHTFAGKLEGNAAKYNHLNLGFQTNTGEKILKMPANKIGFSKLYSVEKLKQTMGNNGDGIIVAEDGIEAYVPISRVVEAYRMPGQTNMTPLANKLETFNNRQTQIFRNLPQTLKNKLNGEKPKFFSEGLVIVKDNTDSSKIKKVGFKFKPEDLDGAFVLAKTLLPENKVSIDRKNSCILFEKCKTASGIPILTETGFYENTAKEISFNFGSKPYVNYWLDVVLDVRKKDYGQHGKNIEGSFCFSEYGKFGRKLKNNSYVININESDLEPKPQAVTTMGQFDELDLLLNEAKKLPINPGGGAMLFGGELFNGYQIAVRRKKNFGGPYYLHLINPQTNKGFELTYDSHTTHGRSYNEQYLSAYELHNGIAYTEHKEQEILHVSKDGNGKLSVEVNQPADYNAEKNELAAILNKAIEKVRSLQPKPQVNEMQLIIEKANTFGLKPGDRKVVYISSNGFKVIACRYKNREGYYFQLEHPQKGSFEINKVAFDGTNQEPTFNQPYFTVHKARKAHPNITSPNNNESQVLRFDVDASGKLVLQEIPNKPQNQNDVLDIKTALSGFADHLKNPTIMMLHSVTPSIKPTQLSTFLDSSEFSEAGVQLDLGNVMAFIEQGGRSVLFTKDSGEKVAIESLNYDQQSKLAIKISTISR